MIIETVHFLLLCGNRLYTYATELWWLFSCSVVFILLRASHMPPICWLEPQGRIFPKIQPTTICRFEPTVDNDQAKHGEVVAWAHFKGQFWPQHPWKPLYKSFYGLLSEFYFFELFVFGVTCLIGMTTNDKSSVVGGRWTTWAQTFYTDCGIICNGKENNTSIM